VATDEQAVIDREVLGQYPGWEGAQATPLAGGLINRTFLLTRRDARAVLQRVSAIFSPRIHETIEAVTSRLQAGGL
jgi:hypothetical protein